MTTSYLLVGTLFLAAAQAFIQTGKEYEYDAEVRVGAGTMDYVPHMAGAIYRFKARMQVESETSVKGEITDVVFSEFVGKKSDDYDLNFESEEKKTAFGINVENGLFKSLAMPEGLPLSKRNGIKAFASIFQFSAEHINAGHQSFKATEQTIHGNCEVSYVSTSDTVYKSINLDKDCEDRSVRRLDDVGGFDCDWKNKDKAEGLVSTSNTIYTYEKEGSGNKVTRIIKNGAFVAQMFNTEGVSHIAMVNISMTLAATRDNPGDIQVGSELTNSLQYEFDDGDYKWNKDRDLKAAEPLLASGDLMGDDQETLKSSFFMMLALQKNILGDHGTTPDALDNAHTMGIETLRIPMFSMNYDTLMAIYDDLHADKSADGVMLSNIFTELLGSTGTTASAMVVLDLVKSKKFNNDRDTVRTLTSVPFHIRRPNAQLVGEFESLLDTEQESLVEMAIPLTFGHLVRKTCLRAGKAFSDEQRSCFSDLGKKWNTHFLDKFKASTSREMRNLYLSVIMNIRFGGQMEMLKPLIYGEVEGATAEERTHALFAASWDAAVRQKSTDFFFPVFADRNNNHEIRIGALTLIMKGKPSTTDIAKIVSVLKTETDYEVVNMVFASLEALASSISPCDYKERQAAAFFLKYLKQFSKYEMDWGFGVSKMYIRQFNQKKYGYGGDYEFHTIGSHESTTPLSVGMALGSYVHHNYRNIMLYVRLRVEGVAKGLIRKFKTMDPATWKTEDLAAIMKSEMSIKERPDQPIRAKVVVMFKGTIIICRSYDDSEAGTGGGKFGGLLEKLQSLGSAYSINHQRILTLGELMVEQPTDLGMPAVYVGSASQLASIKADIKRGSNRGLIYRQVDYHLDSFAQVRNQMLVLMPETKKVYGIVQDRVYQVHAPRNVVIGVHPLKKELKLRVSRAEYDDPSMFMMHSRTSVMVKSTTFSGKVDTLKKLCPTCEAMVVVSAGEGAAKDRIIVDRECEKYGYRVHAKYFDCEMNVARTNTVGRALAAFMPYNKNPRTAWNSFAMGMRQVRAFLLYFPRAEKCGVVAMFSQSKAKPVREIELTVKVASEENGERLFLRGRKLKITATLKANGDNDQVRGYRMLLNRESTPGDLKKKIRVKFERAAAHALGIKPYVICVGYDAQYPPFAEEMFDVKLDKPLSMTGKAMLQYGEGTSCTAGEGEITATFDYSTTQEAREALKKKWYYRDCMKLKENAAWKDRDALPVDSSCYLTAHDASTARRYKYDIKFAKLTDRMKGIIANVRGVARAAMMQVFDIEPVESDIGPFLKVDATLKESDSLADITMETSQGTKTFNDYPLRFNWGKRLRNLKFTGMAARLNKMGIIKPCITTSTYVKTMDNVTYGIDAPSCWTLVSGHCGADPTYAVFAKKGSGKSPLAMKAYIGGHSVDIDPDSDTVQVDGSPITGLDNDEHKHKINTVEVFKITKWGSTFNIYSFLRVWIAFDGNYISVVPAPSVTGQHCGLCGNYNRNRYDETTGKDGESLITGGYSQMTEEWKWKC